MKKNIALILLVCLVAVSVTSCKGKPQETAVPSPSVAVEANAEVKETQETDAPKDANVTTEDKQTPAKKPAKAPTKEQPKEEAPASTLAPSSNGEVATQENAPEIFWAKDISYHLKGCSELVGKEVVQIPWEMVEQIMLRQCPVCNPPKYENYVENDD